MTYTDSLRREQILGLDPMIFAVAVQLIIWSLGPLALLLGARMAAGLFEASARHQLADGSRAAHAAATNPRFDAAEPDHGSHHRLFRLEDNTPLRLAANRSTGRCPLSYEPSRDILRGADQPQLSARAFLCGLFLFRAALSGRTSLA